MSSRTMLEQEFYEQFIDQGLDEYRADEMAHEWAIDSGEYDEVDPWVDPEPWVYGVTGKRAVHPLPQKYYRYAPRTHLEYNTEQEGTKP